MRIQHNIMAMSSYRNYTNNVNSMKANLEKLSSGYKINRAGDDAAGLAISEKMRAQITGLKQAQANAKSGINLVQTAEGALQEVQDMLNRMVKLAEQSANGTFDDSVDRKQLQKEFEKLTKEIDRIADSANFNGIKLLNGDLDGASTPATKAVWTDTAPTINATGGSTDFGEAETLATGLDNVAVADAEASGDGAVKIKYEAAADSKASSGKIGDDAALAGATVGYDDNSTDGNFTIKFMSGTSDGAAWDDTKKELTVTLANDGGSGSNGKYTAAEIQGAITAIGTSVTGSNAPDLTKITVANTDNATAVYDFSAGGNAAVDSVAMSGGAAEDDIIVTVTTGTGENAKTESQTIKQADWTGTQSIDLNGVSFDFNVDETDAWDGTETTLGTVTTTPGTVQVGTQVKIGDFTYGTVAADTDEDKALAAAIAAYNKDATKEWTVAKGTTGADAGKLVFTAKKGGAVGGAEGPAAGPGGTAAEKTAGEDKKEEGAGKALKLQIGDTAHTYNKIEVSIKSIKSDALYDLTTQQELDDGKDATAVDKDGNSLTQAYMLKDISVGDQDSAAVALGALKGMVNYISDIRGELGATQNRLDHTINNLSVMEENIQDAESTIRDTDIAEEMMAYTKNNILIQSAQAMLAQANQVPQGVLQLLQ